MEFIQFNHHPFVPAGHDVARATAGVMMQAETTRRIGVWATAAVALDYIARHTPDREPFGARNVYLGEFGLPENEFPSSEVKTAVRNTITTALDWGCPCVVYWQLYCNEARRRPVEGNDDVRGFWLLRPDGSRGAA